MKNLLIVCGLFLLTIFGCKDKTPGPVPHGNINDLVGSWVSMDSMIGRLPDSTFGYSKDTLHFL
ncbi:MAG: hypothetical protein ACI8Q1_003402 [Parvicella sp.]|jgi:hypothetical protein